MKMKRAKRGVGHQRAHGETILARLADVGIPAALKAPAKAFAQAHAAFEGASRKAEAARLVRDNALENVGQQDDLLDAAVLALADKIVGASLGTRVKPFARFSKFAPSALTTLAYADEVREVRATVAKVGKAKPAADVAKGAAACAKAADLVDKALKGLPGPQSAYAKALGERDALLLAWTQALGRLKRHAAVVWDGDAATFNAVFAPADAMLAPTKKRAKKAASPTG